MTNERINSAFAKLSTPLIADACIRCRISLNIAPLGINPVIIGSHIAGRALPVRHFGSVDIFLEAMRDAKKGDILVIDNNLRRDEGVIGDLTVLEARACGLSGIMVWGCNRDTEELRKIGFPVFSYGFFPAGPLRLDDRSDDALTTAHFGDFTVGKRDIVFADTDGVLFVLEDDIEKIIETAEKIYETERRQAEMVDSGVILRDQFRFEEYLVKRAKDKTYNFRTHLRQIGGAIEE
jgi:regulator of RNase E activity RraA